MLQAVAAFTRRGERFVEPPPTNLSFKFDDTLHAKGVCSLDACQDTKKKPDQIIRIQQAVSPKWST